MMKKLIGALCCTFILGLGTACRSDNPQGTGGSGMTGQESGSQQQENTGSGSGLSEPEGTGGSGMEGGTGGRGTSPDIGTGMGSGTNMGGETGGDLAPETDDPMSGSGTGGAGGTGTTGDTDATGGSGSTDQ